VSSSSDQNKIDGESSSRSRLGRDEDYSTWLQLRAYFRPSVSQLHEMARNGQIATLPENWVREFDV